jgi:hypothetical protein
VNLPLPLQLRRQVQLGHVHPFNGGHEIPPPVLDEAGKLIASLA